jgi:hypothetical protein
MLWGARAGRPAVPRRGATRYHEETETVGDNLAMPRR